MMDWLMHKDERIKPDIIDTGEVNKVSVDQRLAVYGNAYGYRLIDALSENYPSVHTLLGDEDFYKMTYAYMEAYPSHHFSLRYFGHELEEFLKTYIPEVPVLTEMARFEWALRKVFDAEDVAIITMDDLQEIPVEHWGGYNLTFILQCHVLILTGIYRSFGLLLTRKRSLCRQRNWNIPMLGCFGEKIC